MKEETNFSFFLKMLLAGLIVGMAIDCMGQVPDNQKKWFTNTVKLDSTTTLEIASKGNGKIIKDLSGNGVMSWWLPDYVNAQFVEQAIADSLQNISGGINSINSQSQLNQTLQVGTSGSNFNINSASGVHTFNLPNASASATGKLTNGDWNVFNNKQNSISLTTTGASGSATFISNTLNIPNYTLSGLGGVPTSRTITINGSTQDLSANRTWTVSALPSGIDGSVQFNNSGSFAGSNRLFWSSVNNRFSVGLNTGNARVNIKGLGVNNSTFSLQVHDSTGNSNALVVRDDNRVGIGTNAPAYSLSVNNGDIHVVNGINGVLRFTNNPTQAVLAMLQTGGYSFYQVPTLNGDNNNTAINFIRNGAADGILIFPNRTYNALVNRAVIFTNAYNSNQSVQGIDFAFNTNTTIMAYFYQSKYARFFSYDGNTNNLERFYIANSPMGGGDANSAFINSSLGITNASTYTHAASALLQLESTNKGFLPPRNANPTTNISTPVAGLVSYNTTTNKLQVYNGTSWIDLH